MRRLEKTSDSAKADARLLLAHALGRPTASFLTQGETLVEPSQQRDFEALVAERERGVPAAYLMGNAWFFGRRFEITRDVLVPRPETENVVEAVLDELRARRSRIVAKPERALRVVDVGTGSGAIAVTIAAEFTDTVVIGTDVSHPALAVANRNARAHGISDRCTFLLGDLLAPLHRSQTADVIVANLPYVPTADIPAAPNPVAFEPTVAVDGGSDGLALYRRLLQQIPLVAAAGASVFLEAAPPTIEPLAALVEASLRQAHVEIVEDYSGLDRFLAITLGLAAGAPFREGMAPGARRVAGSAAGLPRRKPAPRRG